MIDLVLAALLAIVVVFIVADTLLGYNATHKPQDPRKWKR